jgi:hypothetical protein
LWIKKFFLWEHHCFPKCEEITEIFPLHWFVPQGSVRCWLSSIPARSSDIQLEQLFSLVVRFLRFHNCCPLFQWSLFMGNHRRSADFGLLLRDLSPIRRSICSILCCADVTVSLRDTPVDWDLRKVSHLGGPDDSLDSTSSLFDWSGLPVTNPDVQGSRREDLS